MPHGNELPAEIVDLILDELIEDVDPSASLRDLRACALACRIFCIRAHRQLFSDFKVSISFPFNSASKPQELLDLLRASSEYPGLGMIHHLKSVSLILKFNSVRHSRENSLLDAVFPDILDILRNAQPSITGFTFESQVQNYNERRSGDWSCLSPRFTEAFHNLCSSPSLTTLRLRHFLNVPRSILRGFHVRHLELQVIHFSEEAPSEVDPTRRHDVIQLESLVLPTYWLLPTVLMVLEGNIMPVLEFNDGFQLAFAYITDLTISIITNNRPAYLSFMPQLRTLRLLYTIPHHTSPRLVVQPFVDFFSRRLENTVPSSLQRLAMEIKVFYSMFAAQRGVQDLQKDTVLWPAFDLLLSGSDFKQVLDMKLVLEFVPEKGADSDDEKLPQSVPLSQCKENIMKRLPRLAEIRPTSFVLDLGFSDERQTS